MTTTISKRSRRSPKRGRIFETEAPPQQLEYERKRTELRQRARTHFERLKFGLMSSHPNEYVSIEPETGVYLVEEDKDRVLLGTQVMRFMDLIMDTADNIYQLMLKP